MSKVAGTARRRTTPDAPARPSSNTTRGAVRSSNAAKYETDEIRPDADVHWLVRLVRGAPRDGRACFPERRWNDSPFVLVERRKGPRWKYGSIVICAVLWAHVWWLYHR